MAKPRTDDFHRALELARREAVRSGHAAVEPEHLLIGVLDDPSFRAHETAANTVDPVAFRDEVRDYVASWPPSTGAPKALSARSEKAIRDAEASAMACRNMRETDTACLYLGIMGTVDARVQAIHKAQCARPENARRACSPRSMRRLLDDPDDHLTRMLEECGIDLDELKHEFDEQIREGEEGP